MKKVFVLLLCFLLLSPVFAGGSKESDDGKKDLIVFAAASLTESLTKIGDAYMAIHPDVNVVFTFDSSGTLKTQIQNGADADLFISAAPRQMNQLEKGNAENTEGLDFVLSDTRLDLLENKVALAVASGNPANVKDFDDLISRLKTGNIFLAIGNSDVPVGQYTQEIFAYYGITDRQVERNLTYGSNVKEVTTQVNEGSVDAGIIYATDAFSADLTVVDTATTDMCSQVIYPAAVLNITKNENTARDFLAFLQSGVALSYFEEVGFSKAF